MAIGVLAHEDLTINNVLIQVYQVPSDKQFTGTIKICNRSGSTVKVRLLISDTGSPDASYYLIYDQPIFPGDSYTEAGVILDINQYIFAQTDTADVNVVVFGFLQ